MKIFLIAGGITVVLWIVEELLCTKLKNPLWGGIIPLITLVFTIYILATGIISFNLTSFIVFLVLNLFITEGWTDGREKYKKKQKAELDKIKAFDIDS